MYDSTNHIFQIAEEMVCGSHASIFLTGKAGTGKTTFLRHIKTACDKNLAVVAPTGVAAINAGGTTIHSFFQLPFGPFDYNDTTLFFGKLKINAERRQVFRQLELLIIDEISMVRADLLDAIDVTLRHFRFRHHEPFGGVQVLMIGDMYQLSPVVKDDEWQHINNNYRSHYFFDSRVLQQNPPIHIAFDKIYRQQDQRFVDLLNAVRNNQLDAVGLALLESRYNPQFKPTEGEDYIILTTHNQKAEAVNKEKLSALKGKSFSFKAKIEGEFADRNFPADEDLVLKVGARVMFIKNDTEKVRRYFNGKIGSVVRIGDDKIVVQCKGDDDEIEVGLETWDNIRYGVNKETQALDEDVIGSFKQYPLRLAWAVTIHKSQGLTFDKVVIDAGAAFAPGQVYVALSRCTNLEGIVLLSPVPRHRLANDSRIVQFAQQEISHDRLREVLHSARASYQQKVLIETFTLTSLVRDIQALKEIVTAHAASFNDDLPAALEELAGKYSALEQTGIKFCLYMQARFIPDAFPEEHAELQEKLKAAVKHFKSELDQLVSLFKNIKAQTDSRLHAKEYNEAYKEAYLHTVQKLHMIEAFRDGFSLAKYYAAKKTFTTPSISVNAYAASGGDAALPSVEHPQLYQQLRSLRDDICNRTNSPVYMVASGKTLDELVQYLPQSKDDLIKISGFGKVNSEKYGDQFLSIIQRYASAHRLPTLIHTKEAKKGRRSNTEPKPAATKKESTHLTTLALYRDGIDLPSIAKKRGLALSTIETHMATCVGEGVLDALSFTSQEVLDAVIKEIEVIKEQGLTAAKLKLGDEFSYFQIKLGLQHYQNQQRMLANKL